MHLHHAASKAQYEYCHQDKDGQKHENNFQGNVGLQEADLLASVPAVAVKMTSVRNIDHSHENGKNAQPKITASLELVDFIVDTAVWLESKLDLTPAKQKADA